MSGGHFDYNDLNFFNEINEILCVDVEQEIQGDTNYSIQLKQLLKIMGDLVHAYDWFISGDTGEDTYIKERDQAMERIKLLINKK